MKFIEALKIIMENKKVKLENEIFGKDGFGNIGVMRIGKDNGYYRNLELTNKLVNSTQWEEFKDKDTLSDELKLHKNYVPTMERVKEIYFEYDKSNLVAFVRNAENMELQRCKILFRKYLKEFIQYFSMGKDTRNFSNNEIMVELKKTFGEELL